MDEEGISYEMLQELLRGERRSNKLMPVPARFWAQVRDFLQERLDAFRGEQEKDPFSQKVMRLTDEVKNARHAAEGLWALRERKLAILALAHVREGGKPQGLHPDESQLYQRLVETLQNTRDRVFEGTAPDRPRPPTEPAPPPAIPAPAPSEGAPTPGPAPAPSKPRTGTPTPPSASPVAVPADRPAEDGLVTIRALGDIPPFVGPDMQTYLLKEGDIAAVPPSIAKLLEKRKKAAIVSEK